MDAYEMHQAVLARAIGRLLPQLEECDDWAAEAAEDLGLPADDIKLGGIAMQVAVALAVKLERMTPETLGTYVKRED